MSFEVDLTDRAVVGIDAAITYFAEHSAERARKWCDAVDRVITDLEADPKRFAAARERDRLGLDLRQINFGSGRRLTHRRVYLIRPGRVVVYAVRGLAQRDLTIDDIA